MAIDPTQITTVQVSELPPSEITTESLLAHQIGDVLFKGNVQQLVDYIRAQSTSQPYEIKHIYPPNSQYITDNFDMTPGSTQGLGKPDGLWSGWAIFNGNNGTANLDGQTLIGWGANYNTIGNFVGASTHTLTEAQLPLMNKSITLPVSDADNGGGTHDYVMATNTEPAGNKVYTGAISIGSGQSHNNMQPSMTVLIIYKLP